MGKYEDLIPIFIEQPKNRKEEQPFIELELPELPCNCNECNKTKITTTVIEIDLF